MTSAQPGSPVIPELPPGRLRLTVAAALHRLATRLDRGTPVPAATYRTRPAA
jgi:hypothetical protein